MYACRLDGHFAQRSFLYDDILARSILVTHKDGKILGSTQISARAGEVIGEISAAMVGNVEISMQPHAFPSFSFQLVSLTGDHGMHLATDDWKFNLMLKNHRIQPLPNHHRYDERLYDPSLPALEGQLFSREGLEKKKKKKPEDAIITFEESDMQ